jgi:hypothetical protein
MIERMLETHTLAIVNEYMIITASNSLDRMKHITTCNGIDCVNKFLLYTAPHIRSLVPPRSGQPG